MLSGNVQGGVAMLFVGLIAAVLWFQTLDPPEAYFGIAFLLLGPLAITANL